MVQPRKKVGGFQSISPEYTDLPALAYAWTVGHCGGGLRSARSDQCLGWRCKLFEALGFIKMFEVAEFWEVTPSGILTGRTACLTWFQVQQLIAEGKVALVPVRG